MLPQEEVLTLLDDELALWNGSFLGRTARESDQHRRQLILDTESTHHLSAVEEGWR